MWTNITCDIGPGCYTKSAGVLCNCKGSPTCHRPFGCRVRNSGVASLGHICNGVLTRTWCGCLLNYCSCCRTKLVARRSFPSLVCCICRGVASWARQLQVHSMFATWCSCVAGHGSHFGGRVDIRIVLARARSLASLLFFRIQGWSLCGTKSIPRRPAVHRIINLPHVGPWSLLRFRCLT